MTKISEVIGILEQWAPRKLQEDYDNSGLQVGDPSQTVTGVTISLDITLEVLEEAKANGQNLVIAHHPLIFKSLKSIQPNSDQGKCIFFAIQHKICLYAIHTNLDNIHTGVNAKIGDKIGISSQNRRILLPKQNLVYIRIYTPIAEVESVKSAAFKVGAGQIGNYQDCSFQISGNGQFRPGENANPSVGSVHKLEHTEEIAVTFIAQKHLVNELISEVNQAHSYEEVAFEIIPTLNSNQDVGSGMIGNLNTPMLTKDFLAHIANEFQLDVIRHTNLCKSEIKTVAWCGGSGFFLTSIAMTQKADIYITADIKYHEFFLPENRMILADIGHFKSEQYTSELLTEYISQKFSTFAVRISNIQTDPIKHSIYTWQQ